MSRNRLGPPQCATCRHRTGGLMPGEPIGCPAFPEGIPEAILRNTHDHREPFGDEDLRWQPRGEHEHPLDQLAQMSRRQ
ncbi:hypothetical protein [Streptomonospora litoralis]|uniref:Uncharacterized protein n=1 Tax=Streptomonospora litoralis TaxID=2498135 RepID=A0A4P6Q2G7_9ACTN|nr:hypothetical protein [Streptomonospora litoralis]QBI53431.1 hypothetical protein EKD16_08185 [Streptomonospora litoralis]